MRRLAYLALVLVACRTPIAPRPAPPMTVGIGTPPPAPPPVIAGEDETLAIPCTDTQANEVAQITQALDLKLYNLDANEPVEPLVAQLKLLLSSPCYAIARADGDVKLTFDTSESLRRWWGYAGASWFGSYPRAGSNENVLALPPTPRTTLTSENGPAVLKPLLCPLKAIDDLSCGVESAGWRLRSEAGLATSYIADQETRYCEQYAREDTSGASKYAVFHMCLADKGFTTALPLGAFQAPKDGWLVVSNVRTTNVDCADAISIYDLASGSAYLVGCRKNQSPARLWTGRVPTGALREAALMMMLQHTGERIRPVTNRIRLPADIPAWRRTKEEIPDRRLETSADFHAPLLEWAWFRGTPLKGAMCGSFDSHGSRPAGHAYRLWEIADAAFQEGCTPLAVPKVPWDHLGPRVGESPSAELFTRAVDARKSIANAPPAKAGCPLVP